MALTITRILHAGFIINDESTRILLDPLFESPFSRNCYAWPPVSFDIDALRQQHFDAVFISHFHDDHCSMESLALIARNTPIYLYCLHEDMFECIRALGFTQVYALCIDTPVTIGAIELIPRRALDDEVDSMFHIRAHGLQILNVVDAQIGARELKRLTRMGPWDVLMWPFQNMQETAVIAPRQAEPAARGLTPEAMADIRALAPRRIIPGSCQFIHEPWSWYRHAFFPVSYREFGDQIRGQLPDTEVIRMDPGAAFRLDKHSLEMIAGPGWIQRTDNTLIDYHYQPELARPSTANIARHLKALERQASEQTLQWCRQGIGRTYTSMAQDAMTDENVADDGAIGLMRWRLCVYAQDGSGWQFDYAVDPDGLRLTQESILPAHTDNDRCDDCDWLTEVPLCTLHGALAEGESLSSMYVRINDRDFPPATARLHAESDILQDPLLRCLFNREVSSYQRAQLRRMGIST